MQNSMSRYLELSLQFFQQEQNQFKERLNKILNSNTPLQALKDLSQDQLPIWRAVRKEFIKNISSGRDKSAQLAKKIVKDSE